jgi:hypothetical protein
MEFRYQFVADVVCIKTHEAAHRDELARVCRTIERHHAATIEGHHKEMKIC